MSIRTYLTAAATMLVLATPVAAGEVDDVLEHYFEARGGRDAMESVRSIKMTGNMSVAGMQAPFSLEWKAPNRVRLEFTVQGMMGIQAYDGTNAWWVMPFLGKPTPEEMNADQGKSVAEMADMFPLLNHTDKGHTLEYEGEEDLDGQTAHKLKITRKSGDVSTLYFRDDDGLQVKSVSTREFDNQEVMVVQSIGEYKDAGGVLFPHALEMSLPSGSQTMTFTAIEVNGEVPDTRFIMPREESPDATP